MAHRSADLYGDRLMSVVATQVSRTKKPQFTVIGLLTLLKNSVPHFSVACLDRLSIGL
ncbi:hypothetical protein D082_60480 (plasmid) [Synechocystis sp. PCC 6714]|nr:hypothetical protein D082_60480 [Synechocystis sp. PCC 6714]